MVNYLVFLSVATTKTAESRPTSQNEESLSSTYWLDNPCGVSPAAGPLLLQSTLVDYTPFLLQLLVTLTNIQHWINDFVCFSLFSNFQLHNNNLSITKCRRGTNFVCLLPKKRSKMKECTTHGSWLHQQFRKCSRNQIIQTFIR